MQQHVVKLRHASWLDIGMMMNDDDEMILRLARAAEAAGRQHPGENLSGLSDGEFIERLFTKKTKVTTDDCRNFIVEFQKRNPAIEQTRFGEEIDDEAVDNLTKPSAWKRQYKIRPDGDENYFRCYIDGGKINRYAEPQAKIPITDVAWVRRFDCDGFNGQVAYEIYEMKDGSLVYGDYVGD
jgi:phosphomannomutase